MKIPQKCANTYSYLTSIIYFIVLDFDLLFISTDQAHHRWISKPLLMLILIISLILIRNGLKKRYFIPWIAALGLSLLGDVFLLLDESFFIPGLIADLPNSVYFRKSKYS